MVFKKKQMVMTAVVLMLGIAGYLNYRYDKKPLPDEVSVRGIDVVEPDVGETVMVSSKADKKTADTENEDFFASQRMERDRARSKRSDELKNILSDPEADGEALERARSELSAIALREEMEITAANMLGAKGFDKALVYITEDVATVYINRSGISRSDRAKIVDIIYEVTKNNNIKIVEVN